MAKVSKVRQKPDSRSHRKDVNRKKKCSNEMEKKEWEDATCAVCMERPHNAVLLLCSSYNKGCRPYMCATSRRYSNCLEQYKKAYTKLTSTQCREPWHKNMDDSGDCLNNGRIEVPELPCPLCRSQVKGWTVVEAARKYLNRKRRTCMQEKCKYVGSYRKLRKHLRAKHPLARPREVNPLLAEKWRRLEHERERNDVISTIASTMPGAIIVGDYVIERNYRGQGWLNITPARR